MRKRKEEEKLRTAIPVFVSRVSETEINGQFESVCESVFSEVESQAMEALDLPGSFRTRSHSYLRAIQAGYSQDDDCLPSMTSSTVTSTLRSTTGKTIPPKTHKMCFQFDQNSEKLDKVAVFNPFLGTLGCSKVYDHSTKDWSIRSTVI